MNMCSLIRVEEHVSDSAVSSLAYVFLADGGN
jgi:hypothetical protein